MASPVMHGAFVFASLILPTEYVNRDNPSGAVQAVRCDSVKKLCNAGNTERVSICYETLPVKSIFENYPQPLPFVVSTAQNDNFRDLKGFALAVTLHVSIRSYRSPVDNLVDEFAFP